MVAIDLSSRGELIRRDRCAPCEADRALSRRRIVAVGTVPEAVSAREVDARGLFCAGIIDAIPRPSRRPRAAFGDDVQLRKVSLPSSSGMRRSLSPCSPIAARGATDLLGDERWWTY